jgi:hypothetical protein
MQTKFEMSMIGELSYFLGLQVKQSSTGIFISQEKYLKEILKKFQMEYFLYSQHTYGGWLQAEQI